MRWPAALLTQPRQFFMLFVAAELVLVMAIPFLLIRGYHTLLESRAGTFAEEPTEDDPGWTALVEPTPILGVAEVDGDRLTGVALVVAPGTESSRGQTPGTVALAASVTRVTVGGQELRLDSLDPAAAVAALADALRIDLIDFAIMDTTAWVEAFGTTSYEIDNPDPVPVAPTVGGGGGGPGTDTAAPDSQGRELAFAVGRAVVEGSNAAVFVGRPVVGAPPESVGPRRTALWSALVADPPDGAHPLSDALNEFFVDGSGQVLDLPLDPAAVGAKLDPVAAEVLVRDIVPFPSGNRLKMRIVDRTGSADLGAVAAAVAGRGIEVVEIANSLSFDNGSTELIIPDALSVGRPQLDELAGDLGVEPVVDFELDSVSATLLIGSDFVLPS